MLIRFLKDADESSRQIPAAVLKTGKVRIAKEGWILNSTFRIRMTTAMVGVMMAGFPSFQGSLPAVAAQQAPTTPGLVSFGLVSSGTQSSCSLQDQTESTSPVSPQESKPATEAEKPPVSPVAADTTFTDLIVPDLPRFWLSYSSDAKVAMADVWKVVETGPDSAPVLVCSGKPKGFLYSREKYTDFELMVEWKFPTDANGNSGVLVYLQDEPRIWPTSMQIQFHQPKAGSVFPSGDAKSANTSDADLARPVNTWNTCHIISQGGRLSVEVNGKKAGETTGSIPASGSVALQSEGAEVHFRNIRIRRINSEIAPPSADNAPARPAAPTPTPTPAPAPTSEPASTPATSALMSNRG